MPADGACPFGSTVEEGCHFTAGNAERGRGSDHTPHRMPHFSPRSLAVVAVSADLPVSCDASFPFRFLLPCNGSSNIRSLEGGSAVTSILSFFANGPGEVDGIRFGAQCATCSKFVGNCSTQMAGETGYFYGVTAF